MFIGSFCITTAPYCAYQKMMHRRVIPCKQPFWQLLLIVDPDSVKSSSTPNQPAYFAHIKQLSLKEYLEIDTPVKIFVL